MFDIVFPNTFGKIERLLAAMNDAGVKPELECSDAGHINSIWRTGSRARRRTERLVCERVS